MAKPETAVTKPAETGVATWQQELTALAVKTSEAEKPSGNWMSFRNGILSVGGNPLKGNKANVVVIDAIFENQWYKDKFDPNNPTPPHCFAFAEDDADLKPHADSAEPQAPTCAECPKNAWKSDPGGGKGKWCKNVRRLGVISDTDLENLDKAEPAMAKLPVTSVKNWSTYANQIANVLKLPPLGVVTEISVEPDPKSQFQVNFSLIDKVPADKLQGLLAKRKDLQTLMYAPYDKPVDAPASAPKKY